MNERKKEASMTIKTAEIHHTDIEKKVSFGFLLVIFRRGEERIKPLILEREQSQDRRASILKERKAETQSRKTDEKKMRRKKRRQLGLQ